MSARIDLLISGLNKDCQNSIAFFEEKLWDESTEFNITKALRDILSLIRPFSQSLHIDLTISARDPDGLRMLIKKHILQKHEVQPQKLTSRELEVCNLIIQGYTNRVIAEKIFVSFETVKSHRKNILHKTGCVNTAMLINYFHDAFADKG